MVSTSKTKAVESFSVQVKQYSFIQSLLLEKNIIEIMWKPFHFLDIPGCESSYLRNAYFNEFYISAGGNDFLPSGNRFLLFRAMLKFWNRRWQLFSEKLYSCPWKLIFLLVEVHFFHILDTPASESYFLPIGNVFLNEFFIP